ncbi:MAG: glycosyltransferases involved in cell wall biogenesis [halophilic archaeon J07HX64]|jgi:Glycosyltransferases involved in cell wall biogenesis|nr:MAG: glycosyltransferases involved in cell wall biogenesis [halophilic archaeon J07HX64]
MSQTDDPSAGRGDGDEGDGDTGETVVGGSVTPEGGPATDREPFTFEDVTVVMGTYNEEAAIGTVLADIERVTDGQAAVVCVDGSTDRTAEIARERGAQVIEQEPQGYGVAVRAALLAADRPVVVTTDCDDTYPMEQLPVFLEQINRGYDVVSGDRLYHGADAMPVLNRLGNHLFAAAASVLMGRRVHDTTTGMRAYRRAVIEAIEWTENTGLSAELLVRPAMRGYDVREQPIAYHERAGETKLDPLRGGAAIAASIVTVTLEERLRNL